MQNREIISGFAEILHETGMVGIVQRLRFCVNSFTDLTMGVEIRKVDTPIFKGE